MRGAVLAVVALGLFGVPVSAQTADEIIANYVKNTGGAERIQAIKTLRRTGKLTLGFGMDAVMVRENKRPNKVRQEFTLQGMTAVTAYDGRQGWKIEPFQGKKDPEALGEEELKTILEDADFDGPLIDYRQKGSKVEFVGLEPVAGTDALKLKVTLKGGDVRYFYLDTDYYVPIKIETRRIVRGGEREYETTLGDYKSVGGVYLPHSFEIAAKGASEKQKFLYTKIEANVPIEDSRFHQPGNKQASGAKEEPPPKLPEKVSAAPALLHPAAPKIDSKRSPAWARETSARQP
jgi:hypothetical protein